MSVISVLLEYPETVPLLILLVVALALDRPRMKWAMPRPHGCPSLWASFAGLLAAALVWSVIIHGAVGTYRMLAGWLQP